MFAIRVWNYGFLGLIWGFLAAIILGQWTWLEMRMNIGLFIPGLIVLGMLCGFWAKEIKGLMWLLIPEGTLLVALLSIFWGSWEGILIMPAILFREGFGLESLSTNQGNTMLVGLLILGNITWMTKKHPKPLL